MTQWEPGHLKRIIEGIDHAIDAIAMFEPDGTFIYCNRAWKVLHRLDPDVDYTGQKDSVIDMPELHPWIKEIKSNLGPGCKYVTRKILEIDGADKTCKISVNYISDGERPVVLVMLRDISELEDARTDLEKINRLLSEEIARCEKAQDALVESEQKYRTISEMTSDYTYVATLLPDGTLRREWMAGAFEKITGYTREGLREMLGEFSIVHPEDRPMLMQVLPGLKRQQSVESVEFRIVTKSGGNVWVEAFAKPLPPSKEGYPRGMIAVKDINDRKTAEIELARRNRELAAVNMIRDIFDTETEDPKILEKVLDAMLVNSEALMAGVGLVDKESREIVLSVTRNVPADFAGKFMRTPIDEAAAARIIEGGKVIVLEDAGGHPRDRADAIKRLGVLRTVVFPVSVRDRIIAIYMIGYGKERDLEPEKIRYFEIIRSQVALQLERRELLGDRKWHEKKLKELTVSLIGLLEQERNMMAMKLHDELGQELIAVNAEILFLENQIESCENNPRGTLAKIKGQLKELTRNVRKMSYSIHPAVLEDLGLRPALSSYIDRFVESDDLHVELVTTGFDGKLIGDESLAMYRVAQEALTNVVRHAEARNVTIRIIRGYPDLILTIEDDGKGFTPGEEKIRGRGLGIMSMRERLEGMGGRFRIYSAPGRGTRIRASIPMEGQDDE